MTAQRATKNLDEELKRFASFSTNVLAPTLGEIVVATTKYAKQTHISLREVGELYGNSASKCFNLLFKQFNKGGINRQGVKYKSTWLPNLRAVSVYLQWLKVTNEKTSRSLYNFLVEQGCEPVEWNSALRQWISAELAQRLRDEKDAFTDDDDIDYNALRQALIENPVAA